MDRRTRPACPLARLVLFALVLAVANGACVYLALWLASR